MRPKRVFMFYSSHYLFLVTFGDEVTKIQKYFVIFVYILQGKMGKTEKTERKSRNYSDQNTKNQKTKIWDERNINALLLSSNLPNNNL